PQAAFFLQGAQWRTEPARPPQLQRANYVAYTADAPRLEDDPAEPACRCLEHHVHRLHERLPAEQQAALARAAVRAAPTGDPDHTLSSVREEQQFQLQEWCSSWGRTSPRPWKCCRNSVHGDASCACWTRLCAATFISLPGMSRTIRRRCSSACGTPAG